MAFFYAHACQALDVCALTTVFGNVKVEDATRNALWMIETSGSEAKVYQGADAPLSIEKNPPPEMIHGVTGTGETVISDPKIKAEQENAASFLVDAARENPGELTVCAVGPLTNIARAIQLDPDFVSNLKQLVIMGGAFYAKGNVNEHAEANFWNDPHAADIVVQAPGSGKIVIVGLDVTDTIEFSPEDFDDLARSSPKTGGFLKEIGEFYMAFYSQRSGRLFCSLHDPAAVIACHLPELFEMEEVPLQVTTEGEELGKLSRRSDDSGRHCFVCVDSKIEDVLKHYKVVTGSNP